MRSFLARENGEVRCALFATIQKQDHLAIARIVGVVRVCNVSLAVFLVQCLFPQACPSHLSATMLLL
jgi:hypothetical protein